MSDDEMDPEEMKKESIIGYVLIIWTVLFVSFLIAAYVKTSTTPLCI